jgi:hypothetical protein
VKKVNEEIKTIRVPPEALQKAFTDDALEMPDIPIHVRAPTGAHIWPDPQVRRVCWIGGSEEQLEVTHCGNGRYRIEDQGGTLHFLFEGFSYGSTLVCDERPDGALYVVGFELDPRLDRVVCSVMPKNFVHGGAWQRCGEQIMDAGGNWELLFGGLLSAYVPRGGPPFEQPGDLERQIDAALRGNPVSLQVVVEDQ